MLFLTFIWATFLGTITAFGGGSGFIPVLENLFVQKYNLISSNYFAEIIGYIFTFSAPVAPSIVAFTGFKLFGIIGVLSGAIVLALPPFIILLIAWKFLNNNTNNQITQISQYLSPAIISLIVSVIINFLVIKTINYSNVQLLFNYLVFIFSFLFFLRFNKYILILAFLFGFLAIFIF
jgi:chromate transporter